MTCHPSPLAVCATQDALDIDRALEDKVANDAAKNDCEDQVGLYHI